MKNLLTKTLLYLIVPALTNCQTIAQEVVNQNVSGFTSLEVSSGIDVYLSQNGDESVKIEADEDILEDIIVAVDNNTLIIKVDRDFMHWFTNRSSIKAYVSFKDLSEIQIGGGSDLIGQGNLEFNNLKMTASGGSDIKMFLRANELEIQSSGGSDVVLAGHTSYFKGDASGGSDIKAQELETEGAYVSASGGSDAHITVTRKLVASASGGSDVFYYGNPEEVESNESGGSDVTKK